MQDDWSDETVDRVYTVFALMACVVVIPFLACAGLMMASK